MVRTSWIFAALLAACSAPPPAHGPINYIGSSGSDGSSAGSSAGDTGSTGSTAPPTSCIPALSCPAFDKLCLGFVDNSAKTPFGLRIMSIAVSQPTALVSSFGYTFDNATVPNVDACYLSGSGDFSWLLRIDTKAGTLETGATKPVANPISGYVFDDETITYDSAFHVQPVTLSADLDASGKISGATTTLPLYLPVFLDAAGSSNLLLPLRNATFDLTLSQNHDCIGSYNSAALEPANDCQPEGMTPQFISGGTVSGVISLAEADEIEVESFGESLCVVLSGNASLYGDNASPEVRCAKTGDTINFVGDACSIPGMSCTDAVSFEAAVAAGSVLISP